MVDLKKFEKNMDVPDGIKKIQQDIDNILEEKTTVEQNNKTVYMFFSFDIVNSTNYKSVTANWPSIISELMNRLQRMVYKELATSRLWRVIGDELVFIVEVYDLESVYVDTDSIFKITQNINNEIRNGSFFDCLQDQNIKKIEVAILKKQGLLAIKTAAWLAIISDKECNDYECIRTFYGAGTKRTSIEEFQGQDIDTGFRLKAYTQSRRMILSFELAYLISKRASSSLYIMDFVPLKGVWNGALYPLVWYYNQTIVRECLKKDVSFDESFYYDEANGNALIKAFFARKKTSFKMTDAGVDISMFKSPESSLEKVCFDRNLGDKLKFIQDLLERKESQLQTVPYIDYPLEVHCAVVCCNIEERSVMIVHRGNAKTLYAGKWEFGCAKLNSRKHIIDTITEYYKRTYGIEIRLVLDKTRNEQKLPLPVAVYEIQVENNIKMGVIFVAKIINGIQNDFRDNDMHDSIRYIKEEDITKYSDCAVPDFAATLETVFSKFDAFFSSEG